MTQTVLPFRLFATLVVFWVLLAGSLAPETIGIGVLVSLAISWLFRDNLSYLSGYRMTPASLVATVGFVAYFFVELVKSNIEMARLVLSPALPIDPAIVKVRTRLANPVARLLLANAITLTPGTLTVELEGEWLFIHWVSAKSTDPQIATDEIVAGFEHYLEKMYG